jgi:hypothetical protein
MLTLIMVGGGPDPAGRILALAELSLPFRNAACGLSGVETVIPLRAAASGASLKLYDR